MDDRETAGILNNDDLARLDHPETYTGLAEEMVRNQLQEIEQLRKLDPVEL